MWIEMKIEQKIQRWNWAFTKQLDSPNYYAFEDFQ